MAESRPRARLLRGVPPREDRARATAFRCRTCRTGDFGLETRLCDICPKSTVFVGFLGERAVPANRHAQVGHHVSASEPVPPLTQSSDHRLAAHEAYNFIVGRRLAKIQEDDVSHMHNNTYIDHVELD